MEWDGPGSERASVTRPLNWPRASEIVSILNATKHILVHLLKFWV